MMRSTKVKAVLRRSYSVREGFLVGYSLVLSLTNSVWKAANGLMARGMKLQFATSRVQFWTIPNIYVDTWAFFFRLAPLKQISQYKK